MNPLTAAALFDGSDGSQPRVVTGKPDRTLTPARAWEVLVAAGDARRRHPGARVRFYVEHDDGTPPFAALVHEPIPFLPAAGDSSIAGYCDRLNSQLKGRRFGLMLNEIHSLDFQLWRETLPFLQRVYRSTGVPHAVSLELFLGNYRLTPFGIHKDNQDVITFVVHGSKRFYLWPAEHFSHRPELAGIPPNEHAQRLLQIRMADRTEYRAIVKEAIVLDGQPGDAMFWPASYWHCADNEPGHLALTMGFGLVHGRSLAGLAERFSSDLKLGVDAVLRVRKDGHASSPTPARLARRVGGVDFTKQLQTAAAKRLLEWHTGHAYVRVPVPLGRTPLSDRDSLIAESRIVWLPLTVTEAVVSANGHSAELAAPAAVLRRVGKMIATLNSGTPLTVGQLLAGFDGKVQSSRTSARLLLAELVSWRAIVVSKASS